MTLLIDCLQAFCPRPPGPSDDEFLQRLYASTRDDLRMAAPDRAALAQLIEMQRRVQAAGYRASWPDASHLLLWHGGQPAGRLVADCGADELRVIDLTFVPEMRGQGLGSAVLRRLQRCASERGLPLALTVQHQNSGARRLYLALGFRAAEGDEVSGQMVWTLHRA